MVIIIIKPRVKVCLKCGEYINIFPENPIYQKTERKFHNKHARHAIQIICREELRNNYEKDRFKKLD